MADFSPELLKVLVERELAQHPTSRDATMNPLDQTLAQFPAQPSQGPLSPTLAHLLGIGTDAASTLTFLARKTGYEANPLIVGDPTSVRDVGLSMAGGMAGELLLSKLLGKASPALARLVQSGLAAEHLGAGAKNLEGEQRPAGAPWSTFDQYRDALARSTQK